MSSRSLRPSGRKIGVAATAAALGLSGLGLAASPASAVPGFELERLAGVDRIETAVEISQDSFPSSDTALIARADLYPDALAGNYLAGAEQAPILLSHTGDVPEETLDELERLGAENVVLLGGTAALSDAVETELEAAGLTVGREAGTDRYKTAAEIATSQDAAGIGEVDGARTAILATGERFPDALTGGPLAYAGSHPILLTPTAALGADAAGALDTLGIEHVLILGGTAAVSQAAEDAVEAMGITTERLAGNTRYDTATDIAEWALANAGFTNQHINVATGRTFPDALTGGPHAGEEVTPIILANEGNTAEAVAYIQAHANTLQDGHIFGGTAAVSAAVEAALEAAGQGTAGAQGVTTGPELVSASVLRTTSSTQVSPGNPQGVTIQYCFDEPVTGTSPTAAQFRIYTNDSATPRTPTAAGEGVTIDPTSNRCVNAFFAGATIDTPAEAAALTLAAVDDGAVRDGSQAPNPEGDAPLGAGGTNVVAAGVTSAPDLLSVSGFRSGSTADTTAVDFTFDEATFVQASSGFHLVLVTGDTTTGDNVVDCTAPAPGSTTAGGGTVPGGNGTTTITVTCNDLQAGQTSGNLAFIQASEVARGYVDEDAVADAATSGNTNALQAADVSNSGNSLDPDLVSAAFQPDSTAGFDQVLYTFDEPVRTTVDGTDFCIYYSSGADLCGATAGSAERSPTNDTQVLVTFPDGALTDAVGANVLPQAVQEITSAGNRYNDSDEVGATPTSSTTVTAGRTNGPDLLSVVISQATDAFGVTRNVATYVFDEDTSDAATGSGFHLYLSDGIRLDCAETTTLTTRLVNRTEDQDSTVTCAAFVVAGTATQATNTQVGNAVLGTVDHGVVVDESTSAASPNPIGASATTGGTGTPQQ